MTLPLVMSVRLFVATVLMFVDLLLVVVLLVSLLFAVLFSCLITCVRVSKGHTWVNIRSLMLILSLILLLMVPHTSTIGGCVSQHVVVAVCGDADAFLCVW